MAGFCTPDPMDKTCPQVKVSDGAIQSCLREIEVMGLASLLLVAGVCALVRVSRRCVLLFTTFYFYDLLLSCNGISMGVLIRAMCDVSI